MGICHCWSQWQVCYAQFKPWKIHWSDGAPRACYGCTRHRDFWHIQQHNIWRHRHWQLISQIILYRLDIGGLHTTRRIICSALPNFCLGTCFRTCNFHWWYSACRGYGTTYCCQYSKIWGSSRRSYQGQSCACYDTLCKRIIWCSACVSTCSNCIQGKNKSWRKCAVFTGGVVTSGKKSAGCCSGYRQ